MIDEELAQLLRAAAADPVAGAAARDKAQELAHPGRLTRIEPPPLSRYAAPDGNVFAVACKAAWVCPAHGTIEDRVFTLSCGGEGDTTFCAACLIGLLRNILPHAWKPPSGFHQAGRSEKEGKE